MKRKGFTLIEVAIGTVIISLVLMYVMKYSTVITNNINDIKNKQSTVMSEYQDVLAIRGSDRIPNNLNHNEYVSMIESGAGHELWKYSGEHIDFIKLVGK